jgi:hypothetical protein
MTPRLRDARNAALVTHAADEQQDALGVRIGLPRPSGFSRLAWRKALWAANAYRGHPVPLQRLLEGVFSDWAKVLTVVLDPSRPTSLYSPGAEFTEDLVGRTVRIEGSLYRVIGPPDFSQEVFAGEILDLCPVETASWCVPDWSGLPAPRSTSAEFHAFMLREDQAGPRTQAVGDVSGTAIVYVWPEVQAAMPPTFLLEAQALPGGVTSEGVLSPQPPNIWPSGMSPAGWILDPSESDPVWTETGGPTPCFLASDDVLEAIEALARQLLPVGFKLKIRRLPQLVPVV